MSIERRLAQAEKAAAASHDLAGADVYVPILEDPDFYGNFDQITAIAKATGIDPWAPREDQADGVEPRILTDPDWYGPNENSEDQTDEKY